MRKPILFFAVVFIILTQSFGAIEVDASWWKTGFNDDGASRNLQVNAPPNVIYGENFSVTVTIDSLPPRIRSDFYVYIIFQPEETANLLTRWLTTQSIGKSELIQLSKLENDEPVKIDCDVALLQSFTDGYLKAKIIPSRLDFFPRIQRLLLNCIDLPRLTSAKESLHIYSITEIPTSMGVKTYSFTQILKEEEGWIQWEEENERYEISAGQKFRARVWVFSYINATVKDIWVELALLKPSMVGLSFATERVILGFIDSNLTFKEKNLLEKDEHGRLRIVKPLIIEGFIPENVEEGEYKTQANIFAPIAGVWTPSPNLHNGARLYVFGKEKTLLSNSQLENVKTYFLLLVILVFILGIIFIVAKKYIYFEIDKKLKPQE